MTMEIVPELGSRKRRAWGMKSSTPRTMGIFVFFLDRARAMMPQAN